LHRNRGQYLTLTLTSHGSVFSEKLGVYRARCNCIDGNANGRQLKCPRTSDTHQYAFCGSVSGSVPGSKNGTAADIHDASCRRSLERRQASLGDLYRGSDIQVKNFLEWFKFKRFQALRGRDACVIDDGINRGLLQEFLKHFCRLPSIGQTPEYGSSCPCSSGNICIGPRGGRYCITSGGHKRYGM
jgi:hypothetical protein